jgi:hypothetical protein
MCGVVHPFLRKMWRVLQNYTSSEDVLMGPYGEAFPTYHDANQTMKVKGEAASDAEVEEDPVTITFPKIETEPEVSCVCTVRQITQMYRSVICLSDLHLCLCM